MPLRPSRQRVALWSGLALLLLAAGAVVFDEAWMRPLLQRYVREHAGRRVDFERIDFGLERGRPTVGFRDLRIENATWASTRDPLIRAGRFVVTFTWAGLWQRPLVVQRMTLDDAEVDLEMQADGLRNWRLTRPEDRGPGRVRVLSLDAQRTRMRVVNQRLDLAMTLQAGARSAQAATQALQVQGRRHGTDFEARLTVGDVLTFYDTGTWFPLVGELTTAHARLAADGRAHDLAQLGGLEGKVEADGARFGELAAVLGGGPHMLPALPARMSMRLAKEGDHWHLGELAARMGESDVAGTLDYRNGRSDGSRPTLSATLASQRIDVAPWRAHAAATTPKSTPASATASTAPAPATSTPATTARPATPATLHTDATVDWRIASIRGVPLDIADVHAVLAAHDGTWRADPLTATIDGGAVRGRGSIDTAAQPPRASADLQVTGLALDRVGPRNLNGQLDLQAALTMQGDTAAELLASTSGTLDARLQRATLPAALEAKLGLDAGRWLRAVLGSEARVPVTCSTLQLHFDRGIGTLRRFGLETAHLQLDGAGKVDLPARSLDVTFTPQRKESALLALDRSVRVSGDFGALHTALVDTPAAMPRGACRGASAARSP